MTAQVEHYLSRDGTADYRFRFEQHVGVWRAIIERQPAYGTRLSNAHASHRLYLPDRRTYVCWTPEPTTLDACKDVARTWADCTQVYLATGRFGNPASLPQVQQAMPGTLRYLASDGIGVYRFRLVSASEGPGAPWHVEVVSRPPYAGRDVAGAPAGRVRVGRHGARVRSEPFATGDEARSAAASWAEANQAYIATGLTRTTQTSAARSIASELTVPTARPPSRLERLRRRIG